MDWYNNFVHTQGRRMGYISYQSYSWISNFSDIAFNPEFDQKLLVKCISKLYRSVMLLQIYYKTSPAVHQWMNWHKVNCHWYLTASAGIKWSPWYASQRLVFGKGTKGKSSYLSVGSTQLALVCWTQAHYALWYWCQNVIVSTLS